MINNHVIQNHVRHGVHGQSSVIAVEHVEREANIEHEDVWNVDVLDEVLKLYHATHSRAVRISGVLGRNSVAVQFRAVLVFKRGVENVKTKVNDESMAVK